MKTTTLNNIKKHSPCENGWKTLLKHLDKTKADDEELSYLTILDSNGLDDAIWCCVSESKYDRDWRLFAVWCARQVDHLMEDERSINALNVAEYFANGNANKEELGAARDAACSAARDAACSAARDAACGAARSAACGAARGAACGAAMGAARGAAWAEAWGVARGVASGSARDSAWGAAWDTERDAQKEEFKKIISVESYY